VAAAPTVDVLVRAMTGGDLDAVAAIHATQTRAIPPASWRKRVSGLLERAEPDSGVALVAVDARTGDPGRRILGYLAGEVRSWEFGSGPAGWVFGLAVSPEQQGQGIARRLSDAALRRFREMGVTTVRTMVRRDDVAVLRFFRAAGFVAGPYTELELNLEETP